MQKKLFDFQKNAKLYLWSIAASGLGQGACGVIQGLYVMALGFDEALLGVILSTRMLAAAVAAVPAGILSDRIGRKPVLVAGGILSAVGVFGQALAPSKGLMLLYSCLMGVSMACQATAGAPLLAESSTLEDRQKLFGVNFSLSMIASMVGSMAGGFLPSRLGMLGEVGAYRASLATFGVFSAASVFPAMAIREGKKRSDNGPRSAKEMLARAGEEVVSLCETAINKDVVSFLSYSMLIGFGAGMVVPFFNVFLSKKLRLPTSQVGFILSLSQGATAVAGFISPILAQKYGKVRTVVMTQLASVPFLLLIALPGKLYPVAFSLFMRSALMNMSNPVASGFSMEIIPPEKRGRVSSLMRIADNISRSLSAAVAGRIMAFWSYEVPYFFTAILYILASTVYWRAFKDREVGLAENGR